MLINLFHKGEEQLVRTIKFGGGSPVACPDNNSGQHNKMNQNQDLADAVEG